MEIAGQLILGLGLFFLGMQQVGENLRRLSGPSFRKRVARTTGSPVETGVLGLIFGALMQSATAVTFILVSMVGSGLISPRASLPIITWTNVGLTALAFIVTLNIHPLVAYLVGLSAVLASVVRKPAWQAAAGVILGIGLIFYGLETMGGAAQPLVAMSWFHHLLDKTVSSPIVAFLVGIAVAAILQSNTASTLLVITLAGAGAFDLEPALMLIYGTNLGAIALRLVLAAELRGVPLQLVRFEDLFCVVSAAIMVALFYVEVLAGVPLIRAAITHVSANLKTQLALAFLLSNLLPALAMSPLLDQCQRLLAWLWPATAEENMAKPKYITRQALRDPGTAMDLLEHEIGRLVDGIAGLLALPTCEATPTGSQGGDASSGMASGTPAAKAQRAVVDDRHARFEALGQLAETIAEFATQLSVQSSTTASDARLASLREELALADYLRENVGPFGQSLAVLDGLPTGRSIGARLAETASQLLDAARDAANGLDAQKVESLRNNSRRDGPVVTCVQQFCRERMAKVEATERAAVNQSLDDLQTIAWVLHRLSKVLAELIPHHATAAPVPAKTA